MLRLLACQGMESSRRGDPEGGSVTRCAATFEGGAEVVFTTAGCHMRSDNTTVKSETKRRPRRGRAGDGSPGHVAEALVASPVRQRIPDRIRVKLERALLERASREDSLEEIARKFELERYGISMEMLSGYAATLDELVRPVASTQIVAGVLGCLPASFRSRMLRGNQVLLLSKVAAILWESRESQMEVGELLKLATLLRAAAQTRRQQAGGRRGKEGGSPKEAALFDMGRMGGSVRALYGLSWPVGVRKGPAEDGKNAVSAPAR